MNRLAEEKEFLKAGRFVLRYSFIMDIDMDLFFWGLLEQKKTEMAMRFLVARKDDKINKNYIKALEEKQNLKFAHEILRRFRYRLSDFPSLKAGLYKEASANFIAKW